MTGFIIWILLQAKNKAAKAAERKKVAAAKAKAAAAKSVAKSEWRTGAEKEADEEDRRLAADQIKDQEASSNRPLSCGAAV